MLFMMFLDAPAKLASQKGYHILENEDLLDNCDCFLVHTGTITCVATPLSWPMTPIVKILIINIKREMNG